MGRLTVAVFLCVAMLVVPALAGDDPKISVNRLNDRAIVVGVGEVYGDTVLALSSERGIVVIDTGTAHSLTRLYRARIEETFKRSDFRWVVNTHYHFDHTDGNQVFRDAVIIGHDLVPGRMAEFDRTRAAFIEARRGRLPARRSRLEGLDPDSDAYKRTSDLIYTGEVMCDDLEKGFVSTPPTLTFSENMTLDLGDMTLRMMAFGPGTHTGDDIMIHVPELDLVATGDLFYGGGLRFLRRFDEESDVDRKLAILDSVLADEGLKHVVTVHNGVLTREQLARWRDYMRWVWEAIAKVSDADGNLDDVMAMLDLDRRYPDQAALGFDPEELARQHRDGVRVAWYVARGATDAAREISRLIESEGIEAARSAFKKMLSERDDKYLIDENALNVLGYRFLGRENVEAAIAVFRMTVEAHPEAWNAHDSLGEALAAAGRKEEALASFRRSVELNPDNANGMGWIERLEAGE